MSAREVAAPFDSWVGGDRLIYDVEGDLTALEYTFVELDTGRARCVKAWNGGWPVGILRNKPIEDGTTTYFSTEAIVQTQGRSMVKAGSGGIAKGDLLKVDTGGVVIKATPTDADIIVGQCEYAASEGELGVIRLEKTYARVL